MKLYQNVIRARDGNNGRGLQNRTTQDTASIKPVLKTTITNNNNYGGTGTDKLDLPSQRTNTSFRNPTPGKSGQANKEGDAKSVALAA